MEANQLKKRSIGPSPKDQDRVAGDISHFRVRIRHVGRPLWFLYRANITIDKMVAEAEKNLAGCENRQTVGRGGLEDIEAINRGEWCKQTGL